jgi:hypothetical protein
MWAALSLPLLVLAGTLFLERFETALIGPRRAKPAASRVRRRKKSLLWTFVTRRAGPAPSPDALSSLGGGAELEATPGAVTG